jgi:signal transduction histidine kinase
MIELPNHETARLELARVRVDGGNTRDAAIRQATRICAHALSVERVGVWMLSPHDIVNALQYARSPDAYTSGARLLRGSCPAYFDALHERRVIAAHDARTNPATFELAATYLEPLGITSMLDAPIYRRGDIVGVVCHEHVGAARHWTRAEIDFTSSVADMLSMIFEQADNLLLEAELRGRAARVRDAERLGTLGRLAGTVAHDFNSVLTAITLISSGLERHEDAGVAEQARTLSEAVDLGARLVEQLAGVGQASATTQDTADVEACLDTVRRLVEPLVRDRATIGVSVSLPGVVAALPAMQFIQVLMNLYLNAAEAMERPGTIEVTVRAPKSGEAPDTMVVIEVRDDGPGIPAEIRDDVFNPYFTTKESGTGLGLATVHDIVTVYGGSVVVTCESDEGTTFRVLLPRR